MNQIISCVRYFYERERVTTVLSMRQNQFRKKDVPVIDTLVLKSTLHLYFYILETLPFILYLRLINKEAQRGRVLLASTILVGSLL